MTLTRGGQMISDRTRRADRDDDGDKVWPPSKQTFQSGETHTCTMPSSSGAKEETSAYGGIYITISFFSANAIMPSIFFNLALLY